MKSVLLLLMLCALFCTNCQQKSDEQPAPSLPNPPTGKSFSVTDMDGRMQYDNDYQVWYVYAGVPGTYDTVYYCYLTSAPPEEFRVIGKEVRFSGSLTPFDKPVVVGIGGHEHYILQAISITAQ